jgi:hypothetical protein
VEGTAERSSLSYIDDHPTNFIWTPRVEAMVNYVQELHPWMTYLNTYWDHPPLPDVADGYFDEVSFDVWGGGLTRSGKFKGYRGKHLRPKLGKQIENELFGPLIDWMIYRGRMWVRGTGWVAAPWGPPDSDPDHMHHLHVTYVWNT